MASKKALNAKNLEALGAKRLAELLIEISTGHAVAKRRLRLELAGREGATEVAREIRKRLGAIARSRSLVEWHNQQSLIDDLETQRRAILDQVATRDPSEGLDLMWRFLELAGPVMERCDGSDAAVGDVFAQATRDLGGIAETAKSDPAALADDVFHALSRNQYAQYDALIRVLGPALGSDGLEHLKQRVRSELPEGSMRRRLALREVADVQGDVDAYIAEYDEKARRRPMIAAGIARRLLTAGRAEDAWSAVEAAEDQARVRDDDWGRPNFEWEDARIDVLDALGRHAEAQRNRWSCFERWLSGEHLRAYLSRLPDFDDLEAEERALDHAQNFKNPTTALSFLVSWTALDRTFQASQSALDRAAELVVRQPRSLDGNYYEVLNTVAETLSAKHPLAATLALRAMIDFTLTRARTSRYRHAARHFVTCARLASAIENFGAFETHDAYEARLRREHGRKTGFWSLAR